MMSYADLESAYRRERASPILQKLPIEFYAEARRLAASPEVGEHGNAVKECLEKLYLQRVNKIIHHAGRMSPGAKQPENIHPEELQLYTQITEAVTGNRAAVLEKKIEVVEEQGKPTLKVKMKKALPAIVGSDLKEYGPFREDDVAELPEDNARMLIQRDIAEEA